MARKKKIEEEKTVTEAIEESMEAKTDEAPLDVSPPEKVAPRCFFHRRNKSHHIPMDATETSAVISFANWSKVLTDQKQIDRVVERMEATGDIVEIPLAKHQTAIGRCKAGALPGDVAELLKI